MLYEVITNTNREHAVPTEVLDRQIANFQFPKVSDAHVVIVVDGEGNPLSLQHAGES